MKKIYKVNNEDRDYHGMRKLGWKRESIDNVILCKFKPKIEGSRGEVDEGMEVTEFAVFTSSESQSTNT